VSERGSQFVQTSHLRSELPVLLDELKIQSLLDVPCEELACDFRASGQTRLLGRPRAGSDDHRARVRSARGPRCRSRPARRTSGLIAQLGAFGQRQRSFRFCGDKANGRADPKPRRDSLVRPAELRSMRATIAWRAPSICCRWSCDWHGGLEMGITVVITRPSPRR
jgi:hypothetical protein